MKHMNWLKLILLLVLVGAIGALIVYYGYKSYEPIIKRSNNETNVQDPVQNNQVQDPAANQNPENNQVPGADQPPKEPEVPSTIIKSYRSPINKEVNLGNPSRKEIALTFDAGASAEQTPQILDILKANNLRATFFLTGKWAEENKNLVKQIADDGHTIGNHTYSHPYLTKTSDNDILAELQQTEQIIKSILPNHTTKPYFRAPYGDRNQHVLDVAGSAGYQSIYWTVDALDWQEGATADSVRERIFGNTKNGAIVLMHVGDDITPQVLQEVISTLKNQGYSLVTMDQLLAN